MQQNCDSRRPNPCNHHVVVEHMAHVQTTDVQINIYIYAVFMLCMHIYKQPIFNIYIHQQSPEFRWLKNLWDKQLQANLADTPNEGTLWMHLVNSRPECTLWDTLCARTCEHTPQLCSVNLPSYLQHSINTHRAPQRLRQWEWDCDDACKPLMFPMFGRWHLKIQKSIRWFISTVNTPSGGSGRTNATASRSLRMLSGEMAMHYNGFQIEAVSGTQGSDRHCEVCDVSIVKGMGRMTFSLLHFEDIFKWK